jgi:hypothetical protein
MAGVLPAQRRELKAMQASGPLQVIAGGRYGRLWWIALSNGQVQTVVAGSRVRLVDEAGGAVFTADATGSPPNAEQLPDLVHGISRLRV